MQLQQLQFSKRPIGISFCIFFGLLICSYIYQFMINKLGLYNEISTPIIWIIQNLICCAAFCIIFFNSRKLKLVKIGSAILAIVNFVFTINIATHFAGINIFSFLGEYYSVFFNIVELVAAGLIFFGMRMWAPLQIVGFSYFIPSLLSAFYITSLNSANKIYEQSGDFSSIEKILSAMEICDIVCFIISIVSLILTIIWLNKKEITPSSVSNPINLI